MEIKQIDHFSIRTEKFTETVNFYCEVLDLEEGFRPPFKFPGAWLYAEGESVVHINDTSGTDDKLNEYLGDRQKSFGSGSVDHIALQCQEFPAFRSKLLALGLEFQERFPPDTKIQQIFLEDPNGITIELIFPES